MKSIKCPNCGLVSFQTQETCKRCDFSFSANVSENNYGDDKRVKNLAFSTNNGIIAKAETEDVKSAAWKKIKLGSIISVVGFIAVFGAISSGFFEGFSNTDREYLRRVRPFSLITLLPLAAVLAGVIELATGVSIFKILEKWGELPSWLGWLIGIAVFLLVVFLILFVAAVVVLNFL